MPLTHTLQFVLVPDDHDEPASPSGSSNGFVLLRPGTIESSEPLSPSDRKLYFKRHSQGSPKLLTFAAERPFGEFFLPK